jgi:hypothetical protein
LIDVPGGHFFADFPRVVRIVDRVSGKGAQVFVLNPQLVE